MDNERRRFMKFRSPVDFGALVRHVTWTDQEEVFAVVPERISEQGHTRPPETPPPPVIILSETPAQQPHEIEGLAKMYAHTEEAYRLETEIDPALVPEHPLGAALHAIISPLMNTEGDIFTQPPHLETPHSFAVSIKGLSEHTKIPEGKLRRLGDFPLLRAEETITDVEGITHSETGPYLVYEQPHVTAQALEEHVTVFPGTDTFQ